MSAVRIPGCLAEDPPNVVLRQPRRPMGAIKDALDILVLNVGTGTALTVVGIVFCVF